MAGHTTSFIGCGERLLGVIAFADEIRGGMPQAVAALAEAGVEHTALLTGDNSQSAATAARATRIAEIHADLLPADKVTHIQALKSSYGAVAMVGDGINDAQAMAESTVGIAMGRRSTDVAMETADVIVMSEDPLRLTFLVRHSQRTLRIVKQNLAVALGSKLVFLIVAVLGLATLWMAIAADMGATLLVTFNGLRMLRARD